MSIPTGARAKLRVRACIFNPKPREATLRVVHKLITDTTSSHTDLVHDPCRLPVLTDIVPTALISQLTRVTRSTDRGQQATSFEFVTTALLFHRPAGSDLLRWQ